MMAVTQIPYPGMPGRVYYERKRKEGKTPKEALRWLKRRLSDVAYRQLVLDQRGTILMCPRSGRACSGGLAGRQGTGRFPHWRPYESALAVGRSPGWSECSELVREPHDCCAGLSAGQGLAEFHGAVLVVVEAGRYAVGDSYSDSRSVCDQDLARGYGLRGPGGFSS